jgi:heat shock protein HslJ
MKKSLFFLFLSCLLSGCTYLLESKEDIRGVYVPARAPNKITFLEITPDFRAVGCAGVNRFFGPIKIDQAKKTLYFGMLATTMMMGPKKDMEYEQKFLAAAKRVGKYTLEKDTLTLYDAKGNGILTLYRVAKEKKGRK